MFYTDGSGYERWAVRDGGSREEVKVHNLIAVAEYGLEALQGKVVHHGPVELSWANWGDNISPMTISEHSAHHQTISDQDLVDELLRLAGEFGRTPTTRDLRQQGKYSARPYRSNFGTFNNALEAAGLEPNVIKDASDNELISDLQALAEDIGETPTSDVVREKGKYGVEIYQRRFGSWNGALEAAGLELNHTKERAEVPKEKMINELQRLADGLGRTPTAKDMNEEGEYRYDMYRHEFKSWNKAIKAAGLEVTRQTTITDNELVQELQRLAGVLGRRPKQEDMTERGKYGHSTYRSRFGSWSEALRESGVAE